MLNSFMRWRLLLAAAAALLFLGGCAQPLQKIVVSAASQQLSIEVARSEAEREHGLMERRNLGLREGMLFIFDRDEHLEFWMKNTPLPLSIAFISSDGRILEITDMQPFDERTVRSRNYARYALEMNQGAFQKLGISAGDQLTFPEGFLR